MANRAAGSLHEKTETPVEKDRGCLRIVRPRAETNFAGNTPKSNTACCASSHAPITWQEITVTKQIRGQSVLPKASSFPTTTPIAPASELSCTNNLRTFSRDNVAASMRHEPATLLESNDQVSGLPVGTHNHFGTPQAKHDLRDPVLRYSVPVVRRSAPATCPQVLGGKGLTSQRVSVTPILTTRTGRSRLRTKKSLAAMRRLHETTPDCDKPQWTRGRCVSLSLCREESPLVGSWRQR